MDMTENWRGKIGAMSKDRMDLYLLGNSNVRIAAIDDSGMPHIVLGRWPLGISDQMDLSTFRHQSSSQDGFSNSHRQFSKLGKVLAGQRGTGLILKRVKATRKSIMLLDPIRN